MLTPSVGRGTRRDFVVIGFFGLGSLIGGTMTTSVLWVLHGLTDWIPLALSMPLLLLAAVMALFRDVGLVTFGLPQAKRLVPREIFVRGRRMAALRFGFEMGTGVLTYVSSTTPYVLVVALFLVPTSYPVAVSMGVSFGVARGLVPLLRTSSGQGEAWDGILRRRSWLLSVVASGLGVGSVMGLWASAIPSPW